MRQASIRASWMPEDHSLSASGWSLPICFAILRRVGRWVYHLGTREVDFYDALIEKVRAAKIERKG